MQSIIKYIICKKECLVVLGSQSKFEHEITHNLIHVLDINYEEWRSVEIKGPWYFLLI